MGIDHYPFDKNELLGQLRLIVVEEMRIGYIVLTFVLINYIITMHLLETTGPYLQNKSYEYR